MSDPVEIVPSILSADFGCLNEELSRVRHAGCRRVHIDVMDGHFVPNITVGPAVVRSIRRRSGLFFTGHLMVDAPESYIKEFKEAGLDEIIIHRESCCSYSKTIKMIRKLGMKLGVALRPKTTLASVKGEIPLIDTLLIMTVEPGFGGQKFLPGTERKIIEARRLIQKCGASCAIAVDGGINLSTIPLVVKAGATRLVAGSAVFAGNVARNVNRLSRLAVRCKLRSCV
jgi:ribulose-phosphate 3-epimerase